MGNAIAYYYVDGEFDKKKPVSPKVEKKKKESPKKKKGASPKKKKKTK